MRLEGKKALVTGSSRGIGRAIAVGLAREGCDVIINYCKNKDSAYSAASEIEKLGRGTSVIQADVSKISDIERLVRDTEKAAGRIDILVNNAAVTLYEAWSDISEQTWNKTMFTNLRSAFFCSQLVAKGMIKRGLAGSIVNLSSTNGIVAESGVLAYNVSKGGLEMLTKSLALELASHNIRINALAPGLIETDANRTFIGDPVFKEHYKQHIPLKRFGVPEDCVGAAVFLASEESSYMTGQTIIIDGGLLSDQCPPLAKT